MDGILFEPLVFAPNAISVCADVRHAGRAQDDSYKGLYCWSGSSEEEYSILLLGDVASRWC